MVAKKTPNDSPVDEQATTTLHQQDQATATEHDPTGGASDTAAPPQTIAKDDAFHLLQNARWRAVLRYLLAHDDQERFRMRDLAEEVAAWEHDTTVRQLTSDERQRVYIGLYQSHLPKLDEYGVIRYNQSRGVVEPTPLLGVLATFLEDGLHADTQHLSVEPTTDGDARAECDRQAGLVPTLSNLFSS